MIDIKEALQRNLFNRLDKRSFEDIMSDQMLHDCPRGTGIRLWLANQGWTGYDEGEFDD